MARYIIQSLETGRFLAPSSSGMPEWVVSLREAGGGVFRDADDAFQLVRDNCEPFDRPILIDLDRIGTAEDYSDHIPR